MSSTYNLKLYSKNGVGDGVELGALNESNNTKVITQWLLTPRTKGTSKFFLVLVDQENTCIDAKYISKNTMLACIDHWQDNE